MSALNKAQLYAGPVTYILIGSTYIYYTVGGVSIICETEKLDLQCDQIPGVSKKQKVSHKFTISFKVPELSIDLLKYAYDQPDVNIVTDFLSINNLSRSAENITVRLPIVGGSERVNLFTFYSCYCIGANEVKINKGEQTVWELKFEGTYASGYGVAAKD